MRNMKSILLRLSLLFVPFYLYLNSGHSALITFPSDTEVLVNQSTYFNCSTSILSEQVHWYHYRVGENQTIYVYYKGQFNQIYAERYSIEIDTKTGKYNLIIRAVQSGDAGRYVCQDDVGLGNSSSAELIVLDSTPECLFSMKPNGFVGPNSCYLPLDKLWLSCSVSYIGNILPILQWKMVSNDAPILEGITTDYFGKRAMANLTMSSAVEMDGDFFTCGTTKSHDKQLTCSTNSAKINYAVGKPTILNITKGETTTCSANASVPCTYKWFYGNDTQYPVSYDQVLTTSRLGEHSCEASCPINGINCAFIAMRIYVLSSKNTTKTLLITTLISTIVILLIIAGVIFRIRKERHAKETDERVPLQGDNKIIQSEGEIITRASKEMGRAIAGVAAIDCMIYVVSDKSSEIEMFDIRTNEFKDRRNLDELQNPWDMTSCMLSKRLFIMDIRPHAKPSYVICVDPNSETSFTWSTGEVYGNLSVTSDGNVIVAFCNSSRLVIYGPDGTEKTRVSLSVDLIYPTHALNLRKDMFLICHGTTNENNHRLGLCIIKGNGEHIKNCSETMDTPSYLAVDKSGLIFVADQGNNRVIVLNSDLKLIGVVASKQNGLRSPKGICVVGKSSGKLFVVDHELKSKRRDGKLLIFSYDLSSQKTFCC